MAEGWHGWERDGGRHPQAASRYGRLVAGDVVAELLDAIPEGMRSLSGTALYSGLDAWTGSCPIYLLG